MTGNGNGKNDCPRRNDCEEGTIASRKERYPVVRNDCHGKERLSGEETIASPVERRPFDTVPFPLPATPTHSHTFILTSQHMAVPPKG